MTSLSLGEKWQTWQEWSFVFKEKSVVSYSESSACLTTHWCDDVLQPPVPLGPEAAALPSVPALPGSQRSRSVQHRPLPVALPPKGSCTLRPEDALLMPGQITPGETQHVLAREEGAEAGSTRERRGRQVAALGVLGGEAHGQRRCGGRARAGRVLVGNRRPVALARATQLWLRQAWGRGSWRSQQRGRLAADRRLPGATRAPARDFREGRGRVMLPKGPVVSSGRTGQREWAGGSPAGNSGERRPWGGGAHLPSPGEGAMPGQAARPQLAGGRSVLGVSRWGPSTS